MPRPNNFDCIPFVFSIVLLLRFVKCLNEQLNMMLLHESEKVNKVLDVKQQMRF